VLSELRKERCFDPQQLNKAKLKVILKRLKLNKHYENLPFILSRLQGKAAMKLSGDMEEKLRMMFAQIQDSFERHCPKNRKNFLSYSYVLNKFCQLLGEEDLADQFTLLKSREKLLVQVTCPPPCMFCMCF